MQRARGTGSMRVRFIGLSASHAMVHTKSRAMMMSSTRVCPSMSPLWRGLSGAGRVREKVKVKELTPSIGNSVWFRVVVRCLGCVRPVFTCGLMEIQFILKDSCLVFVIGAGVVFNVVVCLLLYRCLEVGFGVNALRCEQMFEVVVSVCNNAV